MRLHISLHFNQDSLPLTTTTATTASTTTTAGYNNNNNQPLPGTGAGYGPPLPYQGTALSRLVSNTLYHSTTTTTATANTNTTNNPTPNEATANNNSNSNSGNNNNKGNKTEYDSITLPLANPSWQERWERMCTISTSSTLLDLNTTAAITSTIGGGGTLMEQEEWTKREAETWRAGGGFARGEVNITRSGSYSFLLLPVLDSLIG